MRKRTNRELSLVLASLRRGWARRCYFAIHCAGAAGRRGTGTSAACCVRPDVDCFYFGCIDGPGHFFHGQARSCRDVRELEDRLRLLFAGLDGTLCWNSPRSERDRYARRDEAEGRAFVTHRGGWTALASGRAADTRRRHGAQRVTTRRCAWRSTGRCSTG